jgi:hypothetical protein
MNACPVCSGGCLCGTGAKLKRRLDRARAICDSTPTDLERANVARAEAAWASHCHGDWEDVPLPFTTEEEHTRSQVRARYAALTADEESRLTQNSRLVKRGADIAARREGMGQR